MLATRGESGAAAGETRAKKAQETGETFHKHGWPGRTQVVQAASYTVRSGQGAKQAQSGRKGHADAA